MRAHAPSICHHRSLLRGAAALLAGAVLATPAMLGAQRPDSTRAADSLRARGDSLPRFERIGAQDVRAKPPVSPRKAFLYSFLVPGLGQARLDRPNGGALFATVELGALAMTMKSRDDLRFAREARAPIYSAFTIVTDAEGTRLVPSDSLPNRYASRLRARRLHYEDWIAVLVFNHLFAGADAFVAAQLWDMPVRGALRAAGPRAVALAATIEFGGRRAR